MVNMDGWLTLRFSEPKEIMRAYYELIHNCDDGFVSHPERMEIEVIDYQRELLDKKEIKYLNYWKRNK